MDEIQPKFEELPLRLSIPNIQINSFFDEQPQISHQGLLWQNFTAKAEYKSKNIIIHVPWIGLLLGQHSQNKENKSFPEVETSVSAKPLENLPKSINRHFATTKTV